MNPDKSNSNLKNRCAPSFLRTLLLSKRLRGLLMPLACTLFIAGLVAVMDFSEINRLLFIVDMETSASGLGKVYYDLGYGYNESDSCTKMVSGTMQRRTFLLMPSKAIRSIRFNPVNAPSIIKIKDARIEDNKGNVIKRFSTYDFQPIQQIDKTDISDGILTIHTSENANDPALLLENSAITNHVSWSGYMVKHGWVIFGYGLLGFLFLYCIIKFSKYAVSNSCIVSRVTRLKSYMTINPLKSIVLISILSALASCYPVVFFGKSFVSPALSELPCLYDGPPFIPGFTSDIVSENVRSADVTASEWSLVPNTIVEYNAIIKDLEFPFWSRYAAAGIPLYAQGGEFMIGDILHWIPILLGGSAAGWDIKFVLAKVIFAVGIGCLVFRMTHQLGAGLLVTISSCFLGFFAYRFNHPAVFVITYAPWVVLQWDLLGESLAAARPRLWDVLIKSFLLAAITWLQLNAGAPKEGAITACFMHLLGMIFFIGRVRFKLGWVKAILASIVFGMSIVMISAPHWLLFLDVLSKSYTLYDNPGVNTLPIWKIIGFFDNLFFQHVDGTLGIPSTNIFTLLCLSSAILGLRKIKSFQLYGTFLLLILTVLIVYGLFPKSILISIPMVKNIQHVHNTFSVPMMVMVMLLSGYGISYYLESSGKQRKEVILMFTLIFTGLVITYFLVLFLFKMPVVYGGKLFWVILPFSIFILAVALILYRQEISGIWDNRTILIFACFFLLVHGRHGMHLMTGYKPIDFVVMNPTERPDFSKKSDAIEFVKCKIKEKISPVRVIGERTVLYPNYNSMLGLEGIGSYESIRNVYFEKLLVALGYANQEDGLFHLVNSSKIASLSDSLDFLNIGYILATTGTQVPNGCKLVFSGDLDVWERETVWPRAYFVDRILEVQNLTDIAGALTSFPNKPFAAVESALIPQNMKKIDVDEAAIVVPAKQYSLTNNSTRFSVNATGPGLIVLNEAYYPGDFLVEFNGVMVDYVRVNHAFKGVWVNESGNYDVCFTYRPQRLNQAIVISICGLFLLVFISAISTNAFRKTLN